MQRRSGQRDVGRRWPGLPDVLADRGPDEDVPELEQQQLAAGREVAVLVEDAVVRQEVLAVDPLDSPFRADEGGIREIALERRAADERDDAGTGAGDLVDRLPRGADEPGSQEQVLGRVAGDRELREDDEVGLGSLRLLDRGHDPLHVPVEVAHDDVQLRKHDPHGRILAVLVGTRFGRGFRLPITNVTLAGCEAMPRQ